MISASTASNQALSKTVESVVVVETARRRASKLLSNSALAALSSSGLSGLSISVCPSLKYYNSCNIISREINPMKTSWLKRARQYKGWTQEEAAQKLGVSQPYLSLLEQGRRPLTKRVLSKLQRDSCHATLLDF